ALVVMLSLIRLLLKGYRDDPLTVRRSSRYTLSKGFSFSFGEPEATRRRAKESPCTSHDTAPCCARQPPPWLRECWAAASPAARPHPSPPTAPPTAPHSRWGPAPRSSGRPSCSSRRTTTRTRTRSS